MNKSSTDKFIDLNPGEVIYAQPPVKKPSSPKQPSPRRQSKPRPPTFSVPLDKKYSAREDQTDDRLSLRARDSTINDQRSSSFLSSKAIQPPTPVSTSSEIESSLNKLPSASPDNLKTEFQKSPSVFEQSSSLETPSIPSIVQPQEPAKVKPFAKLKNKLKNKPVAQPNLQAPRLWPTPDLSLTSSQPIAGAAVAAPPTMAVADSAPVAAASSQPVTPQIFQPPTNTAQPVNTPEPVAVSQPPAATPLAATNLQPSTAATTSIPAQTPIPSAVPPQSSPPLQPAQSPPTPQQLQPSQSNKKNYMVATILTFLIVAATIVVAVILFWPKIQGMLQSQSSGQIHTFNKVLINLLQVENQAISLHVEDSQTESVHRVVSGINNEEDIEQGVVEMDSDLKIQYTSQSPEPQISSQSQFKLNLRSSSSSNLINLDLSTTFEEDNQAYFKLDKVSLPGSNFKLNETTFGNRWSDLDELLTAGDPQSSLPENRSQFLHYVANLQNLYSFPRYLVLLPVFNIVSAKQYNQALTTLVDSQAYNLDPASCRVTKINEQSCLLNIDHEKLYEFYKTLYTDVFQTDMPAYYNILLVPQDAESNLLPSEVLITFDTARNLPISLTLAEKPQNFNFTINYDRFDDSTFKLLTATQPLALTTYHRQIVEYEQNPS